MKYIKYFENNKNEYKVGDYVLLTNNVVQQIYNNKIYNKGIITNIQKYYLYITLFGFFDNKEKFHEIVVMFDEVMRKLTPEEIKEYELFIDVKNFNL